MSKLIACLSGTLLLTSLILNAETVTVRSGNGTVGGRDSAVTFLPGPPTGNFGHLFTSADFASARSGPAAFIVAPDPLWVSGLADDPSAKWIGTNASASTSEGNTALYAVSFTIQNPFTSASMTLDWAADDGIGEGAGAGPNTGVYLNGNAVCGSSFPIGFNPDHLLTCNDIGPVLQVGINWLYIEDGNAAGAAGLLFSATINTVQASTTGSPINFPNFSSTSGLNLIGSATNSSGTIQLTPATLNTAGAIWYSTGVNVQGGFVTTFSFNINPGGSNQSDGLAFVIQDDPSGPLAGGNTSGGGGAVGTFGISNSVAVAFRTYIYDRIEVDSCGAGNAQTIGGSCVIGFAPATLGGTHSVEINYSGGTLGISLDGTQVLVNSINLESAINLTPSGAAYVGITAGTGDGAEVATINSWYFSSLTLLANPQPTITSLSPPSTTVGGGGLALAVNGNGFITSSSVTFNGIALPLSLVNSGQLTITLPASFLATIGTFPVVVTNPSPGGGASNTALFTVTPPASVPTIATVVNAASLQGGPISPGEIVTITGANIGPTVPAYLTLDQNGNVSTSIGGVQVSFNGLAAPLIYASSSQINAVVPYGVLGLVNPSLQVSFMGQLSNTFSLQSAAAVPALFTLNASGTGPGAILNADGTVNSPANPANRGSYIVLYATGEGQTAPPGVTGKITTLSATPPLTPQPLLPVAAMIGGQSAFLAFYGEAPGLVSGVLQINVQIPTSVSSGILPIQFSVGGTSSPSGVTVSVQ